MKTRIFTLIILIASAVLSANAYDFMVDGLAYNINSDRNSVTVTFTNDQYYYNYYGLTTANIPEHVIYDGVTYLVTHIGYNAFRGCESLTSVTIPNSLKELGSYAFSGCSGLASVNLGNSVTTIDSYAFFCFSGLTSVNLGNSVTTIGLCAFRLCTGLSSITISNSVTYIDSEVFIGCSSLSSVIIGSSVSTIGYGVFYGCPELTSIIVDSNNIKFDSRNNCNAIIETSTNTLKIGCKGSTIPNSVTTLGVEAFARCLGLISIDIPNSVISISSRAFSGCTGLISVTIPNSLTSIEDRAFEDCSNLTSLTIPKSVTTLGNNVFSNCTRLDSVIWNAKTCNSFNSYDCPFINLTSIKSFIFGDEVEVIPSCLCYGLTGLTSITIPSNVTTIGSFSFKDCYGLVSVTWNAKKCLYGSGSADNRPFKNLNNIKSFIFGNEVEFIPSYLCYDLYGLTSINIPNSVTSIGFSAFYGCTGLTSMTIPNSVTSIGSRAFLGCSNLKTAIIGENVSDIGEQAFMNCSFLENIVALRERPIIINSNTFDGVPKASCDLHVRQGSKIRYENQDVWKDFLIILEDAENYADVGGGTSGSGVYGDVNGDGVVTTADVTEIYNILLGIE